MKVVFFLEMFFFFWFLGRILLESTFLVWVLIVTCSDYREMSYWMCLFFNIYVNGRLGVPTGLLIVQGRVHVTSRTVYTYKNVFYML